MFIVIYATVLCMFLYAAARLVKALLKPVKSK